MKSKPISLDLRVGGHGDNWMRLCALYVVAKLLPQFNLSVVVPRLFAKIAPHVFGDRISFTDAPEANTWRYTNRGLRHLAPEILMSRHRFAVPYAQVVSNDWKKNTFKDRLNNLLFRLGDRLRVTAIPDRSAFNEYQGFLEVSTIPSFRDLCAERFREQLHQDYPVITKRMDASLPVSAEFHPPKESPRVLVFPTGTSRQFMPLEWARSHMAEAVYAFFHRDPDAELFQAAGLETVFFYEEPGDMIELSRRFSWTVTTDSFPSHLLQYASEKVTVLITEVSAKRIVSPIFRGKVVDATAPCHPCPHLERKRFPRCAAGYAECINWSSDEYTNDILDSLPQEASYRCP